MALRPDPKAHPQATDERRGTAPPEKEGKGQRSRATGKGRGPRPGHRPSPETTPAPATAAADGAGTDGGKDGEGGAAGGEEVVVADDADMVSAARKIVDGRLKNAGQARLGHAAPRRG